MTDKPTPTDAEILDAAEDFRSQYTHGGTTFDEFDEIGFARAVLAKWGTPAPVGVEPVVSCGNCGGSGRMVRDPDIGTDQECFVCDGSGSFSEPATPQPTQPQAGAVPLDEARRLFDAGWKAAALFCDREDVVADGIIGFGACPQFEAAFSAAHGIKGANHDR